MKVLSIKFNVDSKRFFIYFQNEWKMKDILCYQINSKTAKRMISEFEFIRRSSTLEKSTGENFISWS